MSFFIALPVLSNGVLLKSTVSVSIAVFISATDGGAYLEGAEPAPPPDIADVCELNGAVYTTGKYKTLEKLVNTTELPVLVEQKQPTSKQTDDAYQVEVLGPLTLTEEFIQTFLVVNCINGGEFSLFKLSNNNNNNNNNNNTNNRQ